MMFMMFLCDWYSVLISLHYFSAMDCLLSQADSSAILPVTRPLRRRLQHAASISLREQCNFLFPYGNQSYAERLVSAAGGERLFQDLHQ